MSQPVVVARERPDYAFAVAPKGPFSGVFRDAHKETEMDVCVLALDRLRCPEESRDALIDYASRKFPREKERIGFMDEVICVAERIAGFAPGEAYRKRGVLKKMLGDSARYEEDWYNSAEKYLTMLHNDGDIARFTEKQLLKFLKDTTDSRGVIGIYVDVLFRHYGKGSAEAVAHLTRPELFAAAGHEGDLRYGERGRGGVSERRGQMRQHRAGRRRRILAADEQRMFRHDEKGRKRGR